MDIAQQKIKEKEHPALKIAKQYKSKEFMAHARRQLAFEPQYASSKAALLQQMKSGKQRGSTAPSNSRYDYGNSSNRGGGTANSRIRQQQSSGGYSELQQATQGGGTRKSIMTRGQSLPDAVFTSNKGGAANASKMKHQGSIMQVKQAQDGDN